MNKDLIDVKTKTNSDGTIQVKISHDSFNESIEKTIKKHIQEPFKDEIQEKIKSDVIETINQYIAFKKQMNEERDEKNEILFSIDG